MKVADAMTRDLVVAVPEMSVQAAARLMAELDAGVLPVVNGGRLEGMITDRDIAVRAVALGLGPETAVAEVMTPEARYCFEDDSLADAVAGMGDLQVRRLPVLNRTTGDLVGILSLADAAMVVDKPQAGEALEAISEPGGDHSQADDADPAAPVAPTGGDGSLGIRHFTDDEPS